MNGDIEKVLRALNRAKVRYLIVGGVAVVLHGHLRTTLDLDLVLHLERANLIASLRALEACGLEPSVPVALRNFADSEHREKWRIGKNMVVLPLWNPRNSTQKVDLFLREPFEFGVAYERAAQLELGSELVRVLSVEDLIQMKKEAGRPIDLADVEALEALKGRAEGKAPWAT